MNEQDRAELHQDNAERMAELQKAVTDLKQWLFEVQTAVDACNPQDMGSLLALVDTLRNYIGEPNGVAHLMFYAVELTRNAGEIEFNLKTLASLEAA